VRVATTEAVVLVMTMGSIVMGLVPELVVSVFTMGPTTTVVKRAVVVSEFSTGSKDGVLFSDPVLSVALSSALFGTEIVVIADDSSIALDPTVIKSGQEIFQCQ
jgi:hypothetical protein